MVEPMDVDSVHLAKAKEVISSSFTLPWVRSASLGLIQMLRVLGEQTFRPQNCDVPHAVREIPTCKGR